MKDLMARTSGHHKLAKVSDSYEKRKRGMWLTFCENLVVFIIF